jgi:hypothetical protein
LVGILSTRDNKNIKHASLDIDGKPIDDDKLRSRKSLAFYDVDNSAGQWFAPRVPFNVPGDEGQPLYMSQPSEQDENFKMIQYQSSEQDTKACIYLNPHNSGYLAIPDFLFNHLITPIFFKYKSPHSVQYVGELVDPFNIKYPYSVEVESMCDKRMTGHLKKGSADMHRRIITMDSLRKLMSQDLPTSLDSISLGVDGIILNPAPMEHKDNFIPLCVQAIQEKFMKYDIVDSVRPATHRVLYCDFNIGQRIRMFGYNGNGMSHWMRVLDGAAWIYWAPMTPHNHHVFELFLQGKLNLDNLGFMQNLHFVMRHYLERGDTIIIPPNSIIFEIINIRCLVMRGDFFSSSIVSDSLFSSMTSIRDIYMMDDAISVYIRLAYHFMTIAKCFRDNIYIGLRTTTQILEFIREFLSYTDQGKHPHLFEYQFKPNSVSPGLHWIKLKRESTINNLNLFLSNSLVTIFRKDHELIPLALSSLEDDSDLTSYIKPDHKLKQYYKSSGSSVFVLHSGNVYPMNCRSLVDALFGNMKGNLRSLHTLQDAPTEALSDLLSASNTQYTVRKDASYHDHNKIRMVGTIGDQELSMGGLFNILHYDLSHPDRKLNAFLDEYKGIDMKNSFRYGFDSFMSHIRNLTADSLLDVKEILSYMYAVARYNDIERFHYFTENYLEYTRSHDPEIPDFPGLRFPISVRRFGSDDDWVMAFIVTDDINDFMSAFERKTKLAVKAFSTHNDKSKKIERREWCGICTRFVLLIMSAGSDKILNIIRFHVCKHINKT